MCEEGGGGGRVGYLVGVRRWDFCDFEGGGSYLGIWLHWVYRCGAGGCWITMMTRDVLDESYLASMRDHEPSIQDNAFMPT